MLKIKWTDRITSDEIYQRAKEGRLLLKILQNRSHSGIGHTVGHNGFVVNILEGAISGKNMPWEDLDLQYLTLRRLISYIYIYIYIYIYGAPILDVSRSHTTTQHSR